MPLPKFKIPLFDIDWTLLKGENPAHLSAYDFVIHNIFKLPTDSIKNYHTQGKIDKQILLEIALSNGIPKEKALGLVEDAVTSMVDYFMKNTHIGHYDLMPGALELLEKIKLLNIPMGLLTGNIEEIGWEKVRIAGIKDYFIFGAFGNMAFKRAELIPQAKKRAEKIYKTTIPLENFVIVGDSPLDIACARAGGIPVIAVGSGHFKSDELTKADLVVDTLEEKDKILNFLQTSNPTSEVKLY